MLKASLIALLFAFSSSALVFARVTAFSDPDAQRALSMGLLQPEETDHYILEFQDESGANWKLQVYESAAKPEGPSFFVPHDNENEAFLGAAWALSVYGGHVLALECGEKRECAQGIDPNRHFLPQNRTYISTIMNFFESKPYPVITLHNNHDSHRDLGGEGAIYADMPIPYADGKGVYHQGDPDDLIIYADVRSSSESPAFSLYDREFADAGVNSIFEHVHAGNSLGGHMSTHVIRSTPMEYFNVEAQHGHLQEQRKILEKLLKILNIRPI